MSANSWDERHRRGEYANLAPLDFVRAAQAWPPGHALDLASGPGRHARFLASLGWQVTAVDASAVALEPLRGVPNLTPVVANLEDHFAIQPAAWDLIVMTLYLQRDIWPRLRDGVKPGGRVALANPCLDPRPGVKPMRDTFLIEPHELRAAFAGWHVEHDALLEPPPPSRRVAELIARKP
jgi:SAM-dependent methyltransferase